ncbi:MAG: NUDIX domain-containing protein [Candidatus Caldarchaeum sp.]
MKRPELTVGAFIVDEAGRILLVVSLKWNYLYSIPGGHVDHGERIFDAVIRETREEVGLDVKPVRIVALQEVRAPSQFVQRNRHFIFVDVLCKPLSRRVRVDGSEVKGYVWAEPRKALSLPLEKYTERLVKFYAKNPSNFILVALDE